MTRIVKPVPAPAKILLDFISIPESKGDYNVWSGFKQRNLPKVLTTMTINEVLYWQKQYKSVGGPSSAAGRYQIIRKTLAMLVSALNLDGSELFDEAMQDRLGYQLLKIRGYDAWIAGDGSYNDFANKLAREWASLPVVTAQKNYKGVWIKPGQSYYAGDGLNAAHVTVGDVQKTLSRAYQQPSTDDAFVYVPTPKPALSKGKAAGAAAAGGAVVVCGSAIDSLTPEQIMGYYTTLKPVIDLAISYGPIGVAALVLSVAAYWAYKEYS